jgi:Family of unknown function (DUF6130)
VNTPDQFFERALYAFKNGHTNPVSSTSSHLGFGAVESVEASKLPRVPLQETAHRNVGRKSKKLYQSAMDQEPGLRAAYLVRACQGDEQLRREVDSLLALNDSPLLVDEPAWQAAAELLDSDSIVATGTQLGPYRIGEVLAAGGMGQVYRARDTRLDRPVAIKVSREEFSGLGAGAANVSPRVGHLHVSVDDPPSHWADFSENAKTIVVAGLPPGEHKLTIELAAAADHSVYTSRTVAFTIPKSASH